MSFLLAAKDNEGACHGIIQKYHMYIIFVAVCGIWTCIGLALIPIVITISLHTLPVVIVIGILCYVFRDK